MELSWLYSIPRTVFLDRFFLFFTQLPGAIGQLWLIVGIVLLFFKRTRKTGAAVLVSYIGVLLFGELLLKHVVTRMRPCQIDQTFAMLVERPTSSSFPSTHSAFAFGTAMAIFMNHRRAGVLMFIVATLVAFSRLYLFVHDARSESGYESVHVNLKTILGKTQKAFKYEKIEGTLVCVYFPDYMDGINASGWHLHFISNDKKYGGHVFDFIMKSGKGHISIKMYDP